LEVGTYEPKPALVRGDVGLVCLHGVRVPIDPDELGLGSRVEDAERVAPSSKRSVDDDPSVLQCRKQELDDGAGEDGLVSRHIASVPALSSR
jgi:hypothetical protein